MPQGGVHLTFRWGAFCFFWGANEVQPGNRVGCIHLPVGCKSTTWGANEVLFHKGRVFFVSATTKAENYPLFSHFDRYDDTANCSLLSRTPNYLQTVTQGGEHNLLLSAFIFQFPNCLFSGLLNYFLFDIRIYKSIAEAIFLFFLRSIFQSTGSCLCYCSKYNARNN